MRYVSLLLITFFFASCGNQKMRFVRTNNTKQKVVEIAEIPSLKKSVESNTQMETNASEPQKNTSVQQAESSSDLPSSENSRAQELDIETTFPIIPEDSTTLTPAETQAITDEAIRAEKFGNRSLTLSILIYVLFAAATIILIIALWGGESLVAILASVILMIAALASMISSFVFGILSLRSKYNTPQGRRRAIAGIVLSSIVLILILLNIALSF